MHSSVSRKMIESLMPKGSIWFPEIDGNFDFFLDGLGNNLEIVRTYLDSLGTVRNPQKTIYLSDLEKEFGLIENKELTDSERRDRLTSAKTSNNGDGTEVFLENKLREAGFNLFVYRNNPIKDPNSILDDGYTAYLGGDTAYCGHSQAICGRSSGILVVNGGVLSEVFSVPLDSDYWQFVFFIGGEVTRDASGAITVLASSEIPIARREEIIRLIVKYKPLHSWCVLMSEFIQNSEDPPPDNGGDIVFQ